MSEENIEHLSPDELCFKLRHEVLTNKGYYADFVANRDIVDDIENYITKMEYNNDTIDLVLAALCNCLGVSVILYQVLQNEVNIFAHAPGREFRGDIHIAKSGLNGNAHYNCIGLLTNVDDIHNDSFKDTVALLMDQQTSCRNT